MTRNASKRARSKAVAVKSRPADSNSRGRGISGPIAVRLAISLLWFWMVLTLAGRRHLVMGYRTISADSPWMDAFFASYASTGLALFVSAFWFLWAGRLHTLRPNRVAKSQLCMASALLPLACLLLRVSDSLVFPALYWEPLWFAAWSGLAFAVLTDFGESDRRESPRSDLQGRTLQALAVVVSLMFTVWWYAQTCWYYQHYLLGFNDFGHFSQRVANTAAGRGLLLETPVLPIFWDHFNPGLLALVPIWKTFPSVHSIFWIQAACLAGSGWIVWRIALALGRSPLESFIWSCAWLVQPALGQMNVSYTYGWHPISIAIPLLLLAVLNLIRQGYHWAALYTVGGMLMEEGVIVVVSCFCAACALSAMWNQRAGKETADGGRAVTWIAHLGTTSMFGISTKWWLALFIATACCFAFVYRFSGIAEFQTGRFVALGDNLWEIMAAPILRPKAFWGALLLPQKAAYVMSLLLPCFLLSLWRGRHILIAAALPLGVVLVWDHLPASCLAFQYASALLPIFWLSSMLGGESLRRGEAAMGALVTGLILSLCVGQLPYSAPSILGVVAQTYGPELDTSRGPDTRLGQWLNAQVDRIRNDGGEVLATSRIAAHLVGNRDIETVGQYLQRRDSLARLNDRSEDPISHYRWIILDRKESFQQTPEETMSVMEEAKKSGFEILDQRDEIVLLQKPPA